MEFKNQCPRCGAARLRAWSELNDEDRELVQRLPASAEYSPEQRQATHRWCKRCWYEDSSGTPDDA